MDAIYERCVMRDGHIVRKEKIMSAKIVLTFCATLVIGVALIAGPANARSTAREQIPSKERSSENLRLNLAPAFSDRYLDPQSVHAEGRGSSVTQGLVPGLGPAGSVVVGEHGGSSSVPEPSTVVLLGAGLVGFGVWRLRQHKTAAA